MRTAFAILCSCVLLALGVFVSPARAGGGYDSYYDGPRDGYYPRRHQGRVWYSSDCCYKKIVRHERSARYVRIEPYRRHSYYEPPYRPYRPYRPYSEGYAPPPPRYGEYYVVPPQPGVPLPPPRYEGGYGSYNSAYSSYNYAPECYRRRVPVLDGRGGWVWGFKQVCN